MEAGDFGSSYIVAAVAVLAWVALLVAAADAWSRAAGDGGGLCAGEAVVCGVGEGVGV